MGTNLDFASGDKKFCAHGLPEETWIITDKTF
jgi:hypothetical protein